MGLELFVRQVDDVCVEFRAGVDPLHVDVDGSIGRAFGFFVDGFEGFGVRDLIGKPIHVVGEHHHIRVGV